MTSTVLARKYRPTGFAAMVGQGHVVQALGNALQQKRLHHAYLFTGTRGVGKTTVSRILAKALNCVGPDGQGDITSSPCGHCQPCRDIDAGRFVDYVELDAASNRGVEEISQLLEQAVYKPVVGRFKVYMIDEVHMLSNTAFNAMLKTLEEPPDYLKFVLATTDPQKVPVTVLSRCLQFNLRPMAVETVQEHLQHVLQQESIACDPDALRLLARAARGSMRDALSLTDQAIAFGAGALQEDTVRQMLGSVDRVHVQRIVTALAQRDAPAMVAAVDQLRQLGLSAAGTLEDLAVALQRMAVYQAVPAAQGVSDPDERLWADLAGSLAPDETQLYYSLALQSRAELALAPDEYGGLVMALLRCLAFAPGASGSSPPKARGLTEPATGAVRPAAASSAPAPSPVGVAVAPSAPVRAPSPPPAVAVVARPSVATGPATQSPAPAVQPVVSPAPSAGPVRAAEASQEPPPWADMDIPVGDDHAQGDGGVAEAWSEEPEHGQRRPVSPPKPTHEVAVSAPAEAPRPVAAEVRSALPSEPGNPLDDLWHQHVMAMSARGLIGALVRELGMQAQCIQQAAANDGATQRWVLRVERESLCTDANRERLQGALSTLLGAEVVLELERGRAQHTPAFKEQTIREARQRAAEALIEGDAVVQDLLQQFPGAQLIAGSIRPL